MNSLTSRVARIVAVAIVAVLALSVLPFMSEEAAAEEEVVSARTWSDG